MLFNTVKNEIVQPTLCSKCRICGKLTPIEHKAQTQVYYICDECAVKLKKLIEGQ